MSWFDDVLDGASIFDWVTPLYSLVRDVANGPATDFYFSRYDYTAGGVKRTLASKGVEAWGVAYDDDWFCLSVRDRQAKYAAYILKTEGISHQHNGKF